MTPEPCLSTKQRKLAELVFAAVHEIVLFYCVLHKRVACASMYMTCAQKIPLGVMLFLASIFLPHILMIPLRLVFNFLRTFQAFQQELESRQGMLTAMKAASASDQALAAQTEQLSNLWDRVNQLSELRENRLHGAMKLVRDLFERKTQDLREPPQILKSGETVFGTCVGLTKLMQNFVKITPGKSTWQLFTHLFQAEEFSEAVQVVREWLPHAEAELKFKALPEDEDQIVQLIESHEVNLSLDVCNEFQIHIFPSRTVCACWTVLMTLFITDLTTLKFAEVSRRITRPPG